MKSVLFDERLMKRGTLRIEYVDDGVKLSDLNLAAMVLNIVDGTECREAVAETTDGGAPSRRFLFYVRGDVGKIRTFITAFFAGQAREMITSKLQKFALTQSHLKLLLDKARVEVVDNCSKTPQPTSETG